MCSHKIGFHTGIKTCTILFSLDRAKSIYYFNNTYRAKGVGQKDVIWRESDKDSNLWCKIKWRSVRETARISAEEYPEVNIIVQNDTRC